eukprot:4949664-Pyramimonas_sp.AAC.1
MSGDSAAAERGERIAETMPRICSGRRSCLWLLRMSGIRARPGMSSDVDTIGGEPARSAGGGRTTATPPRVWAHG